MMVTPSGRSLISNRPGERGTALLRAAAIRSAGTPTAFAAHAAASALATWCSPGRRSRTGACAAWRVQGERRAARRVEGDVAGPHGGVLAGPVERHRRGRLARHGGDALVVGVEEREPASRRGQVPHQFRLGVRDAVDSAHRQHVRRPDIEHQADLGPSHPHEMGDVTRPRGAHLQDEVTGLPVSAQDRQREPDLVVKGTRGGDGRRLALEDLGEQVLGGGLADRPGEPDDDGVQPVPYESGQFGQRGDHVVCYYARPVDGAGAQHRDGAGGSTPRARSRGRRCALPRWPRTERRP